MVVSKLTVSSLISSLWVFPFFQVSFAFSMGHAALFGDVQLLFCAMFEGWTVAAEANFSLVRICLEFKPLAPAHSRGAQVREHGCPAAVYFVAVTS